MRIQAERRQELLLMEGKGFNKCEIAKHLAEKYGCSPRNVYRDFELRGEWQPTLTQIHDAGTALLKCRNRYDAIYREASFLRLQTTNENAQVGFFRVMLDATKAQEASIVLSDVEQRVSALEGNASKANAGEPCDIKEKKPEELQSTEE